MRKLASFFFLITASIQGGLSPVAAQERPSPDLVRDLAPTGKLRAAINFGNGVLVQKSGSGHPVGVSPELAEALSTQLGVPLEYVTYTSAGQTFTGAAAGACRAIQFMRP